MSERNGTQSKEGAEKTATSPTQGGDIRFLNQKKKKSSKTLVVALLILLGAVAYALLARATLLVQKAPPSVTGAENASTLVDRIWVDRVPERDRDSFSFYVFGSEENVAMHDLAPSIYRHALEIFFYRATARDLQFQFPHDRRSARSPYTVEKLGKPEKHNIDLKLTIAADPQSGGTQKVYYSSTQWNALDRSTLPQWLRQVSTEIPAQR